MSETQVRTIDLDSCPMLKSRQTTQFFRELTDPSLTMDVNGSPMLLAVWNMIISHRDLKLWCNLNMKPNRAWKVSHCKKYFGIKGSGQKLLDEFEALKAEVDEILLQK